MSEYTVVDHSKKESTTLSKKESVATLSQNECCRAVFKHAFDTYKKINSKKSASTVKLEASTTNDYLIFKKIKDAFEIFQSLLKFAIITDEEYFEQIRTALNMTTSQEMVVEQMTIPKKLENLVFLCSSYPRALLPINDDLHDIISVENYEGLLLLNNLNPLFYYSAINDTDISRRIEFFEEDTTMLLIQIKLLLTKLMKKYLHIYNLE